MASPKFEQFDASDGGQNVAGNYSRITICGAAIKKECFYSIVFIALVAILVPVSIVKLAPLHDQNTQNK